MEQVLVGNLTADPEYSTTDKGVGRVFVRIAATHRVRRSDGDFVSQTAFVSGVAWGELAGHIADTFHKGDRVVAIGHLETHEWDDADGEHRQTLELQIRECAASVLYTTVIIPKGVKQPEE